MNNALYGIMLNGTADDNSYYWHWYARIVPYTCTIYRMVDLADIRNGPRGFQRSYMCHVDNNGTGTRNGSAAVRWLREFEAFRSTFSFRPLSGATTNAHTNVHRDLASSFTPPPPFLHRPKDYDEATATLAEAAAFCVKSCSVVAIGGGPSMGGGRSARCAKYSVHAW
jgi:hypothetical protein